MSDDQLASSADPSDGRHAADPEATQHAARYDFDEIDLDSGSVHANVVALVGESRRVLELGPATGYMSRVFRDRGCAVVGIELDPDMAQRAAEFCERVVIGDIDDLDLDAELADDRFDVIVAADVLEHLKDPLDALDRLRPFLAPDGFFVLSVPNVAHGSVRLALLSGRFPYQEAGLLDSTHLRFFTHESLEEMLIAAELGVAELRRHELNIDASEVPFDDTAVPAEVRAALDKDEEARTYQFVVKATPMPAAGLRELQRCMLELAEMRETQVSQERVDELETALAMLSEREGELRHSLIEAHDQLLRRDAELMRLLERCTAAEQSLSEQVGSRDEQIGRLQVRLDRLLQSPPARVYAALRNLPGMGRVAARRQAGYEAELARQKQSSPGG
jgi:O-antigen biosynthesis protein